MSTQMIICLIISALTVIGYLSNKLPMGVVAMLSLIFFYLTGCITSDDAMTYFGNPNLWLCVCMFVVSAGFTRTQFVKKLARKVNELARGSVRKVFFGYMIMGVILCQFIGQAVAEFSIVAPLLGASVDELGVKRSKVMYPLAIMLLATMAWLPLGAGYAFPMQVNSMFETFDIAGYSMSVFHPFLLRLPGILIVCIYIMTIGLRLAPDEPLTAITGSTASKQQTEEPPLPPFQEKCGYVIFFATCAVLLVSGMIGLQPWLVALAGAVMMVLTGVLRGKQINDTLPEGNPVGIEANAAYFGFGLIVYAIFNFLYLTVLFRSAYQVGKAFVIAILPATAVIALMEYAVHLPSFAWLDSVQRADVPRQLPVLAAGVLIYVGGNLLTYKAASKQFERVDL